MDTQKIEKDNRTRFLEVYSNLPINLREEIILVLEKRGPISWNVAYLEIKNNTELGESVLKKLEELKII